MMAENAGVHGVKKLESKSASARQRWKLLGKAILNQRIADKNSSVSVRRFLSFDLLTCQPHRHHTTPATFTEDEDFSWFKYKCRTCPRFQVDICQLTGILKLEDFFGFNNTGNVCIWPSEEVLTYYCLDESQEFENKSVCELGGGMTCLAGVAVAVGTAAKEVLLTDGNEKSIRNIQRIVDRNSDSFGETKVCTEVLRWDDIYPQYENHFDSVICADCLFFDECREDLAKTIHRLLKIEGEAVIFAPNRGSTFQKFIDVASCLFHIERKEIYNDFIWEKHLNMLKTGEDVYDPDIHYPVMLKMKKR